MNLTEILWALFLMTFLFWTGLETPKGEIVRLLRQRGLMMRGFLAEVVLAPILGWVLAQAFQLSGEFRTGFLLVACLPGGLMALNFIRLARGNIALAAGVVFILNVLAILLAPLLVRLFFQNAGLRQPGLLAIVLLLLLVVLPFYLGRLVGEHAEKFAHPLSKALNIASLLLFVAANVTAMQVRGPAVRELETSAIGAIVLLVIGSWIISWLLGGKDLRDKKTFALMTSIRNFAVARLLCMDLDPASQLVGAVIAFSGIAVPMNMIFGLIMHWIGRPAAGRVQPRTA